MEAAVEFMSSVYDKRRMPMFLENVAPDAEVHADFLDILDSFQRREDGTEVLADTVKELTGGDYIHIIATQSLGYPACCSFLGAIPLFNTACQEYIATVCSPLCASLCSMH